MRTHRLHTEQRLREGAEVYVSGKRAHYLSRVLRIVSGQSLILFDGSGKDFMAEVVRPGKKEVVLQVGESCVARPESPLRISVVQAIGRGERMDWALQKCTEMGVSSFVPLVSERVEVRIHPDKLERRMEHWRHVIISACEQSGRSVVPAIAAPCSLSDYLATSASSPRLVLDPEAEKPLAGVGYSEAFEIIIGPEGGFSDAEFEAMKSRQVRPVSVGPRIMRTETAGAVAAAVLQALHGDFR